jgi:HEAT repeat protein
MSASLELPITYEAIRGLAANDDDDALKALRKSCAASDQFLRRTAVEIIGKHQRGRELVASVLNALRDPSEYVQRTACEVVGQWKLAEAHDVVLGLLAEPAASTRASALRALSTVWKDADLQPAFEIYRKDPETGVRREAAWVLKAHADANNWRALFNAFCKDPLARHRVWACELAAAFGSPDILPILSSLAEDPDGHVRKAAVLGREAVNSRTAA